MSDELLGKLQRLTELWEKEADEAFDSALVESGDVCDEVERIRKEEEYRWGIHHVEQLRSVIDELRDEAEEKLGMTV